MVSAIAAGAVALADPARSVGSLVQMWSSVWATASNDQPRLDAEPVKERKPYAP